MDGSRVGAVLCGQKQMAEQARHPPLLSPRQLESQN